jgi:hypothetical protein
MGGHYPGFYNDVTCVDLIVAGRTTKHNVEITVMIRTFTSRQMVFDQS